MRNAKKIIAIILALLIFSALPMNVFAATPVNNIVIDIDSDIAGKTVDDYEDYVSFTATGIQFRDEKCGYPIGSKGVEVYEEEEYDNDAGMLPGKFVAGDTYTFCIYLAATEGYSVPDDATVTVKIDGVAVSVEDYEYLDIFQLGSDYFIDIDVDVDVAAAAATPVNNIVIDIDSDIAGKTVADYEDYVSFTATGLQFEDAKYGYDEDYTEGIWVYEKEVYENGGNLFTGEFVGGDTYIIEVYLAATEGYSIPKDATVTVKIDGVTVAEEDYEYLKIYRIQGYDVLDVDVAVTVAGGGFFQGIIDAISGFFASIIAFFRGLFTKVVSI